MNNLIPFDLQALATESDPRGKLYALQEALKEFSPAELTYRHFLAGNVYVRELFLKKGTVVVGFTHKRENVFIQAFGDMSLYDGEKLSRISGYEVVVTKPGTKRAVYTHEDTMLLNVFYNRHDDESDPEAILWDNICVDDEEFQNWQAYVDEVRK